jgi:RNA polymerase sigma-70 factor (ECF subfamily)
VNDEELALVRSAREGDSQSYGRLVDRYRGRVYALAVSIARAPDEAERLVRETFVRAWTALPTLQRPERFPAWLSRITYKAGVEQRAGQAAASRPPAATTREVLDEALGELPEPQRVALDLRVREQLDYAEIAETLDLPADSVRDLLARATATLREKLPSSLFREARP